jgi:cation-transporting ATPase E
LTIETPAPSRPNTSQPITGLTTAEVEARVARGESNAFKARVGRTYWDIVRDNVLNLFNIVLFSLLMVVLWFGDYGTVFFAGFSVVTNSFLGMIQEISAKRKLDKLAALSEPEIRVWRDGRLITVNMHDLVKDDVIPLEPGDKIVVDGKILESDSLEMDESQLTGESDAVLKDVGDKVFSGSFCIAGSGLMVATVVGKDSTINKLAAVAKTYKNVLTPTQQRISLIVQISVVIMAVCTPMIFIAGYLNLGGIFNLNTFRNAVVFVTSIVPQGLVLTAILSLTIGAITISRRQTLVQRVNAVESMANVNVFCFDKTGTLTKNQLTVSEFVPLDGTGLDAVESALRRYLSNLSHLNRTAAAVAHHLGSEQPTASSIVAKIREVPFTSARKWGAVVLPDETLILGAPERVLPDGHEAIEQAESLAAQGLRVLAFARSSSPMSDGVLEARDPLALIVLTDEVRENMRETLDSFADVGVTLKVISGDNLETVRQIAQKAGMTIRKAFTGDQIDAMDETELASAVADGDLFARIEPDTKRRIVAALKRQGYYVGMTGDGVNDVPALKEAHLAVVMNDGAQISKDVADIVLLNNALTTLPEAFREGRTITQTIFGTSKIFLVKNLYSLLFFIFAGFMLMPFPINPIQISWMTFGVINIPATLIAFRILKPEYMQRFRRDVLDYVFTAGFIGSVAMALLYAISFLSNIRNVLEARSTIMMFMALWGALVFLNTHGVHLYAPRSVRGRERIALIGIVLAAGTILIPYIPLASEILEFRPPTGTDWMFTIVIFVVASLGLHYAMKTRILVNRIWGLTAPP